MIPPTLLVALFTCCSAEVCNTSAARENRGRGDEDQNCDVLMRVVCLKFTKTVGSAVTSDAELHREHEYRAEMVSRT